MKLSKQTQISKIGSLVFLLTAFLSLNARADTGSKDGTSSASESSEHIVQNGRATLTLEDMKTLLGMKNSRDPSDVTSPKADRLDQEEPSGRPQFFMNMSLHEKKVLSQKISTLQARRAELVVSMDRDTQKKKNELRGKRHDIQNSRMSAHSDKDSSLSKNLYENLLQEANLDAKRTQKLADFDSTNSVSLDFVEVNGQRHIETIRIGETKVWGISQNLKVAQEH